MSLLMFKLLARYKFSESHCELITWKMKKWGNLSILEIYT